MSVSDDLDRAAAINAETRNINAGTQRLQRISIYLLVFAAAVMGITVWLGFYQ